MKKFRIFSIVLMLIIIIFAFIGGIGYLSYQQKVKLFKEISQDGVVTQAESYGVKCGKGESRKRQYRFKVENKFYYFEIYPTKIGNLQPIFCRTDTLGDKITVYYLSNAPYRNLSKLELDYGIPDMAGYYFIFVGLIMVLSLYIIIGIALKNQILSK